MQSRVIICAAELMTMPAGAPQATTTYDDAVAETTDLLQVFSEPITDVTGSTVEDYIAQSSTQTTTTQAPGAVELEEPLRLPKQELEKPLLTLTLLLPVVS